MNIIRRYCRRVNSSIRKPVKADAYLVGEHEGQKRHMLQR